MNSLYFLHCNSNSKVYSQIEENLIMTIIHYLINTIPEWDDIPATLAKIMYANV